MTCCENKYVLTVLLAMADLGYVKLQNCLLMATVYLLIKTLINCLEWTGMFVV